jgi:hypothetical protein
MMVVFTVGFGLRGSPGYLEGLRVCGCVVLYVARRLLFGRESEGPTAVFVAFHGLLYVHHANE